MLKKLMLLACVCVSSLQADVSTVSLNSVIINHPRYTAYTVAAVGFIVVLAITKMLKSLKPNKKELIKSIRGYFKYVYGALFLVYGIDMFIAYRKAVAQNRHCIINS